MARTLTDRFTLTWADPNATGRRSIPLGLETFTLGGIADLLTRAEQLLAHGHSVTIQPPASRIVDTTAGHTIDPTNSLLTISAS